MRRSLSSCDSPGPRVPTPAADGAPAAAEALEVLPHAAHAREVVLELRELDLELALGADGVLGEDVEDQLRPVDDARRERVLERPLLGRRELVVDEQHVGPRVPVRRLQLLELPLADVEARGPGRPVLDERRHRLDACGACELPQLGELLLGVRRRVEHGEHEPALLVVGGRGRRSA